MKSLINEEYLIFPFKKGIKLLKPEQAASQLPYHPEQNSHLSLADAFNLPHNVYILNHESKIQGLNTTCVESLRFHSIKDSMNKSVFDISPYEYAKLVIENDHAVLKKNQPNFCEDNIVFPDGSNLNYLSFKAPWYNEDNKIIGIFGCSILYKEQSLAKSLMELAQLGLFHALNTSNTNSGLLQGKHIDGIYLTKREKEILHHLIRGKTAREISNQLFTSRRTIEKHLSNIKVKLNVSSKSELIQKVLDLWLV